MIKDLLAKMIEASAGDPEVEALLDKVAGTDDGTNVREIHQQAEKLLEAIDKRPVDVLPGENLADGYLRRVAGIEGICGIPLADIMMGKINAAPESARSRYKGIFRAEIGLSGEQVFRDESGSAFISNLLHKEGLTNLEVFKCIPLVVMLPTAEEFKYKK